MADSQAKQEFIDQQTRQLMVQWCRVAVSRGDDWFINGVLEELPYLKYAVQKKWLSLKEERPDQINTYRVLSAGWQTAARFLKR